MKKNSFELKATGNNKRWYVVVSDGRGEPLFISAKVYKRKEDALAAYQKLDRQF